MARTNMGMILAVEEKAARGKLMDRPGFEVAPVDLNKEDRLLKLGIRGSLP